MRKAPPCHIKDKELISFLDMFADKIKNNTTPRHLKKGNLSAFFIIASSAVFISLYPTPSFAFNEERVLAVVNGAAVTTSDVSAYQKILSLGGRKISKSGALNEAIETHLKIQEAENKKTTPSEDDIKKQIEKIATASKKTPDSFLKSVAKKGIDVPTYRKYLKAQLGWNRIISRSYGKRVQLDDNEIQSKYNNLKNNPKRGVTLAILQPLQLPFDKSGGRQIIGSRVADAKSIESRFKSCGKIRSITNDIYNVRILKRREIPLTALPAKTRQFLRKRGAGSIVQMNVNAKGGFIQMMAYCGNRSLKAPIPSLEQYKNKVFFDQMQQFSSRHMKKIKDLAIIEIKSN